MPTTLAVPEILKKRIAILAGAIALVALCLPAAAPAAPLAGASRVLPGAPTKPAVLTFKTAEVGAPGNPAVGIVPFSDAIYSSCAEAPARAAQTPPARKSAASTTGTGSASSRSPSTSTSTSSTPPTPRAPTSTALQRNRERLRLAPLRPDRLHRQGRARPPLHARLRRLGRQALRLRQLPALGPLRQLALQRQGALAEDPHPAAASTTSPTGSGSRARPRPGCTT